MLDITLVAVGKLKNTALSDLSEEYLKRLKPYVKLRVIDIAPTPFTKENQNKAKEQEGKRISDYLVTQAGTKKIFLLAERGKNMASPELAGWFDHNSPLVLVIGGALGFNSYLYDTYPQLSLSALTFPHELARVILLEQIYRAATILNKKDYHY